MFQLEQSICSEVTGEANGRTGATDKPSETVALVGHLSDGTSDDYRRLYMNEGSELYLEIHVDDIVDRSSPADGDRTAGQSMIWVRRDATLAWYESVLASSFATPAGVGAGARLQWPRP